MNIYGYREAWRLQYGYEELTEQNRHVTLRSYSDWGPTLSRMMKRFPQMPSGVVENLFLRRSEVCIDGKCIGVMPVLRPNEVPIRHGSEHYASMTDDPVSITMDIHDVRYGIFMPAVYEGISEPVDAIRGARVSRMMVYDGVFRGLLRTGDRVETVGTLQRVRSGPEADDGNEFYQIMVGTKNGYGREFIHVVKASA
jgi:predicted nucleotidyltransferase